MQLSISGHHLEVTDAIQKYVENKFSKLDRHNKNITTTHVILSIDKHQQKAEATIHISGAEAFAHDTDTDLYAAIDKMVDKLDRQLIKHREKKRCHK